MKSKRNWRGASIIMAATAVVAFAVAFAGIASATTLPLPDPTIYDPVAYGDSLVYSLELQNLIQNNNKLNPNSQFNVSSSEGAIKDLIVIGTGAKGLSSTNTKGVADDAYNTPSGSDLFFNTRASEPTNGPAVGDLTNSWEVSIAALITYLTDPVTAQTFNLVFLVDSNQVGSGPGQTQFFWGRVQGVDALGNNIGGCFDLTSSAGDGAGCVPITELADGVNPYPGFTGNYVEDTGVFCMSAATGVPYLPDGSGKCLAGDFGPVNANVGSASTEFALYFPLLNTVTQLQALLAAGAVNLSMEFRFNNTDGYDTIWLCDRCSIGGPIPPPPPPPVPAPASLLLLGSGMIGISALAWRRARHQA